MDNHKIDRQQFFLNYNIVSLIIELMVNVKLTQNEEGLLPPPFFV